MLAALITLLLFQAPVDLKSAAREKIRQNPFDPAIQTLVQQLIAAKPNDAEAHFLYGQWAILNHQEEISIREETRAVALSPGNLMAVMQAYTLIAIAEDVLDHEARALAAFRRAREANLKLPSPDAHALSKFASFLAKRSKEAEARSVADEALRADPKLGAAHLIKAKLLVKSGQLAAALKEGEFAAKDAEDAGAERAAHAFLAKTYFAAGMTEQAQMHQTWIETHGNLSR